eukprot:15236379-Alexandrium_andersonii.AAC.1
MSASLVGSEMCIRDSFPSQDAYADAGAAGGAVAVAVGVGACVGAVVGGGNGDDISTKVATTKVAPQAS